MPSFTYTAIDKEGKEVKGKFEVSSHQDAITKIRELGYYPTSIVEEKARGVGPAAGKTGVELKPRFGLSILRMGGNIGPKQLALFTRQLATLIAAGLPLVRALHVLERQEKGGVLKGTIHGAVEYVEGGGSFSEALSKYPQFFSPLYVNTVKAGETGGVLEVVLNRLAEFAEKTNKLNSRIKAALIYPALVLTLAGGLLAFLITFIVPRFMEIIKDVGATLPLITRILLTISTFAKTRWFVVLASFISLIIIYRILCRIPRIKLIFDNIKLHTPVVGPLIRKIAIARFSTTLGTLLTSGVPILQALLVAKDTSGNEVIARSIINVHNSVREGETVARPLLKASIFPAMAVNMISVGEESGSLDQMLLKIGDIYDEEVDVMISGLMSLLEPFLIIAMGLIVGFIVVSMFLPLFSLITALGGG